MKKSFDGIIHKPVSILCAEPSMQSEWSDECFSGTGVFILERLPSGWFYIETSYGYRGWIKAEDLWTGKEADQWSVNVSHQIKHFFADILAEPAYQSLRLCTLPAGSLLNITSNDDKGWTQVCLAGNVTGWVRSLFLEEIPEADFNDQKRLREQIIETALGFMGTQYRWGGKTKEGIDCSGLCALAYQLNGLYIYRDSVFKNETLREISKEELEPADLLYFPGHVGMYLGNDKVLHSTAALSGVVINSLNPSDTDYRSQLAEHILHMGSIFPQKDMN